MTKFKAIFLTFQNFYGKFCLLERFKQPVELQPISMGLLRFPSQVELIIYLFDQAISEPHNNVLIWWGMCAAQVR